MVRGSMLKNRFATPNPHPELVEGWPPRTHSGALVLRQAQDEGIEDRGWQVWAELCGCRR
jgi:hypothetical protein